MREKELPIVGLDSLKKYYEKRKFSKSKLKWEPLKADVIGDLGYTFGSWELNAKADDGSDTTVYGLYSTVWKNRGMVHGNLYLLRQPDSLEIRIK